MEFPPKSIPVARLLELIDSAPTRTRVRKTASWAYEASWLPTDKKWVRSIPPGREGGQNMLQRAVRERKAQLPRVVIQRKP